jgi:hypothetical protein
MSKEPKTTPIALFSEDGKTWDEQPNGRLVTKIVIGALNKDKTVELDAGLWDEVVDKHWPTITHLHLWHLEKRSELPELPKGLKCLDVRGCKELTALPGLPSGLETLDLGECIGIVEFPKNGLESLRWFYVDECANLPSHRLEGFLEDCVILEEFTATNCTQLTTLVLPKSASLRKVVLEDCSALTQLPDLAAYKKLSHLNVNGCKSLTTMPPLCAECADTKGMQPGIQYLVTHLCDALRHFEKMDLRPVHLSQKKDENVAPVFRTMQRLGGSAEELVMSKLLLLGSGRCGKTTIGKALQWSAMDAEEKHRNPKLDPTKNQESTPNILFYQWNTDFDFSATEEGKKRKGMVHIWDFGGQEVYHNTHRLFASEGAVFVIATTDPETHRQRKDEELKDILLPQRRERYETQNEYRELKYWLDYIRSALGLKSIEALGRNAGEVKIRVVHTGRGSYEEARQCLLAQAGAYRGLLELKEIDIEVINFHSEEWEKRFEPLSAWVGRAIGGAADQFGVNVPGLFADTANHCGEVLGDKSAKEVLSFEEWCTVVESKAPKLPEIEDIAQKIRKEQAIAVATYLHNCGRIFWLNSEGADGEVLINQQWGIDLIYELTNLDVCPNFHGITGSLFEEAPFKELMLEHSSKYRELSEPRRAFFMHLLNQCNTCVRVGNDKWMAVQSELLPENGASTQEKMVRIWQAASGMSEGHVNHSFALHGDQGGLLGDSDYRAVLAFIARGISYEVPAKLFGDWEEGQREIKEEDVLTRLRVQSHQDLYQSDCHFWNNGFLIDLTSVKRCERVLIRIDWAHCVEQVGEKKYRSFEGGMFVQILSIDESVYGERFRSILFEGDGPLALFKDSKKVSDNRPVDLSESVLPLLRGFGQPGWIRKDGPPKANFVHDVAISYKSTQESTVKRIVSALEKQGLVVYHYSDDDRLAMERKKRGSFITEIYDYLAKAKVLIIVASADYFETPDLDEKRNLYIPVELAEAIVSWDTGRPASRLFWVLGENAVSNSDLEKKVMGTISAFFTNVIEKRKPENPLNDNRSAIDKREEASVLQCQEAVIKSFLDEVGRTAKQTVRIDSESANPFNDLVGAVLESLKGE